MGRVYWPDQDLFPRAGAFPQYQYSVSFVTTVDYAVAAGLFERLHRQLHTRYDGTAVVFNESNQRRVPLLFRVPAQFHNARWGRSRFAVSKRFSRICGCFILIGYLLHGRPSSALTRRLNRSHCRHSITYERGYRPLAAPAQKKW